MRDSLVSWQSQGFVSEAWRQRKKDILKYEVHFSPPLRMAWKIADSFAFLVMFPEWQTDQVSSFWQEGVMRM